MLTHYQLALVLAAAFALTGLATLIFLANTYIGARSERKALRAIERLVELGFAVTSDPLGEFVKNAAKLPDISWKYLAHLKHLGFVNRRHQRASISLAVKPSRLGLGLDADGKLFMNYADEILREAGKNGIFVWFDAEKREAQKAMIAAAAKLSQMGYRNLGCALQSMHRSSLEALNVLIEHDIPVRIVKGAYGDGELQSPTDVRGNFVALAKRAKMFYRNPKILNVAAGTHDTAILDELAMEFVGCHVQYQFLFGIRTKLQEEYRARGEDTLIYFGWGSLRNALGYLLRRLKEGIKWNALKLFYLNVREAREFKKKHGL